MTTPDPGRDDLAQLVAAGRATTTGVVAAGDAVDTLRGYITRTAETAPAAAVAAAHAAVDTLDRHTCDLLPLSAVADRLRVGEDLARHLVATGRLPSVRLGYRTIRVPAAALARLATGADAAA